MLICNMNEIDSSLIKVSSRTYEEGWRPYYLISNQDGKQWVLPTQHLRVAMELYQPSGYKGILLKKLFPFLHRIKAVRKSIGVKPVCVKLSASLQDLLSQVFDTSNVEFSYFGGSPGPRQKVTLQIFQANKILGYLKYSNKEAINQLFLHEVGILKGLSERGVTHIPEVLYYGQVEDMYVYIQSSSKTLHSTSVKRLTNLHLDFIMSLCEKTKMTLPFEQTGMKRDIDYLLSIWNGLPEHTTRILKKAIDTIKTHYQDVTSYSFIHGDFTPWNIYVERGKVYAFDFEYAEYGYPPYFDLVHFILQIEILVKQANAEIAFAALEEEKKRIPVEDVDYLIMVYLLRMFSHYNRLFSGQFSPQDRSYRIWIELLKKYTTICQKEKF